MIFEMLIAVLVMMIMFMVLTVLFLMKTPAMTFLVASLSGKPVLQLFRRDRAAKFVTAKFEAGMAKTKQDGNYMLSPESVFTEPKSGVRICSANQDLGLTIPPEAPEMVKKFSDAGIETLDQAEAVDKELEKDGKELSVTVAGHTINFGWLRDWIAYNLNPFVLESILQKEKAAILKEQNVQNYKWVIYVAVLLVAGAVAALIIMQTAGTQSPIDVNALANAMVNAQTQQSAQGTNLVG